MPQNKPADFDPGEFAPAFDPEEFAPAPRSRAATIPPPEAHSWFDTAASYIPMPVRQAASWAASPLTNAPSEIARDLSFQIDQPTLEDADSYWLPRIKGFAAGATQGIGDVISSFTSPLNLATMGSLGAASGAARAGYGAAAKGLTNVGRGLSAPVATQGAYHTATAETPTEALMGVAEVAGGLAGVKAPVSKIRARAGVVEPLPVKPPITTGEAPIELPVIPEALPVKDPNFAGGMGDAELAGSVPYQAAPETLPVKTEGFDPGTLEFVDPKTGEVIPASQAKPGDIPIPREQAPVQEVMGSSLPPETSVAPEMPSKLPIAKVAKAAEKAPEIPTTPKQEVLANATPEQVTQSLSDRLRKASEDPNTSPDEIKGMLEELDEVVRLNPNIDKPGLIRQVLGTNKALLTSWDVSAPGRQGKAFILNKAWWTSLDDMVRAWGSKQAADLVQQSIAEHPSGYFKRDVNKAGKETKSFAEKVGLELAHTEEAFDSPAMKSLQKWAGVEKSSRAHTAFLNKLRSDQFASMMEGAKKAGLDPENNLIIAKKYADFINSATGRGSLDIGKWKLSRNTAALNDVFFAPKNLSGQIRTWGKILNPRNYSSADPVMRKQAIQSLLAVAGVGLGVGEMARLAGAKVSNDPTSSDFRKIKIGDTRIDLFGGYQQFPVAAMKLLMGKSTSTTSGQTSDLSSTRYGAQTRETVAERFFTNRLSPLGSFVYAWMSNKEFDGQPFEMKRALFERVFPIAAKDIIELAQEDPASAAALGPSTLLGLTATQHYTGR